MSDNNPNMVYQDGIQKRCELRRSSAINYHQHKFSRPNYSSDYQQMQRPATVCYELSDDLRATTIKCLEKCYGGKILSNRAARIIQRFYRKYRLQCDYQRLKIEKRASRKLELGTFSYGNSTFKSPTNPSSPETIIEIKTLDIKKQSSYEDLVIDQAYQDWDKKLDCNQTENNECSINIVDEHNSLVNTDSGVESVETSSVSLTPSPTTGGNFSILTSSASLVISKFDNFSPISIATATSTPITATDSQKHSYKISKPIPISHSTTLCDHKHPMVSSTYCDSNVPMCIDLNHSFHNPSQAPKQNCSVGFNNSFTKHRCTGHAQFQSCSLASYLSNPRLIGSKFQKNCFCQAQERQNKRLYRVCLNIFNKNSIKGINHLLKFKFIESKPDVVAKFLMTRKGVSRSAIGDYLGQTKDPLAMDTLKYFVRMVDMKNKDLDIALRYLLSFFHIPGESQKITCIMEEFQKSYIEQNFEYCTNTFKHLDTIMILAYAIIMLHTDLYNPNVRANQKMTKEQFIRNLRKTDCGRDINKNLLNSIYDRIKASEMKTLPDHTNQVRKIDEHFSGDLRPHNLIQPHRRLVCYCRLYEVMDLHKRDRAGSHQREVFLFNDLLVITKSVKKRKKEGVMYQCRIIIDLSKVEVFLLETEYYKCGIQLKRDTDLLVTLNTRTLVDRQRFVDDLVETVAEVHEMDRVRIDDELLRQQPLAKTNVNETTSEVILRKHNSGSNCDQSNKRTEKISDSSLKKKDFLLAGQSKSISSEDSNLSPCNRHHRRSASIGGHSKKSITDSTSVTTTKILSDPIESNDPNRISGDSGLLVDFE